MTSINPNSNKWWKPYPSSVEVQISRAKHWKSPLDQAKWRSNQPWRKNTQCQYSFSIVTITWSLPHRHQDIRKAEWRSGCSCLQPGLIRLGGFFDGQIVNSATYKRRCYQRPTGIPLEMRTALNTVIVPLKSKLKIERPILPRSHQYFIFILRKLRKRMRACHPEPRQFEEWQLFRKTNVALRYGRYGWKTQN